MAVSTRPQWQKIRGPLNHLVEKTWVVFDDKIIECEDYQEMNRASLDQVITDLSRLVEHSTDFKCVDTERRQNDLEVFHFNITFIRCSVAAVLLQHKTDVNSHGGFDKASMAKDPLATETFGRRTVGRVG